jgi:ligand-binding sensor domain-containing protein/signal transduction histidine kinase
LLRIETNPIAQGPASCRRRTAVKLAHALSCCLLVLPFMCVERARALEPTTPLANYGRQTWVMENGLPQNTVQALAQTRDGFIWLGTEAGLVRFDGNSFVLFDQNSKPALPGNDIRCLLAASDGALWIGTREGVARLQNGLITTFTFTNGLPSNDIRALAQANNQALFAWTSGGLARLENDHFVDATAATRLPADAITRVISDGEGTVWVGTQDSVSLYRDGHWASPEPQSRMFAWTPATDIQFLAGFRGGQVASADKTTVAMLRGDKIRGDNALDRFTAGKNLPGSRIQALFADHSGALWIGTNAGLVRCLGGKIDRFPVTDPLGTASILSVLEDHEGNLWVGTETGGLHILRDERFRTFGTRDGLSSDATTTVAEDNAGTLWVGTSGYGLDAVSRSGASLAKVKSLQVKDGLSSDVILSVAAAPNGDLWVGTPDGLNRIRKGVVTSFTSADGLPDDFVRSLLVDADGSLWIGTRRGLAHMIAGGAHFDTFSQANGLGSDLVGAMARDAHGNLWVATLAGLSRLQGAPQPRISNFTSANGLSSNVITALLPRGDGTLLIGTQGHGWNIWDGHGFSPVEGSGLNRTTIHAIVDDEHGHLWFATENGIARCDCNMAGGCSHWMEFGAADGLRGRAMATNSHPSAWRTRDGWLWFATPKGLVVADPAHFPVNTVPPPVALVRFAADDVDQPLRGTDALKVQAGHNHFQFDYAGLSFTAPQKVRYRYMLEGFDHQWTDAGIRRSAYYTNIPPGTYTFHVQASNNDGVWNKDGAAFAFTLRPHFYQTIWFYILLAALAAGFVVLLLRLRLLRAEREFRAVLAERNRIAREVHDTLAQGYVGVSVQLEVVSELLRSNKTVDAVKHLDTTRQHVREGLAEARQSIWALRSQDSGENTLPVKLRRATELANGHGVEATFSLFGAFRPMPPGMEMEFLRVGQEAIHNVKKHAGAIHLSVQLEYGPAEIALVVRDDGQGFEMRDGYRPPPGHFGLTGMRERADAIGGTLEVTSAPGVGTTVRLQVMTPKEASRGSGE